jgi:hypothetical protein
MKGHALLGHYSRVVVILLLTVLFTTALKLYTTQTKPTSTFASLITYLFLKS